MYPGTDIDIGLATPPPATEWIPLDRKRILEHFRACHQLERIDRYLQATHDLLPNEKVILFWLAKVFEDSHATIDLYARYSVQLLNHARKDFHHIGHQDVEAFLQGFRYRQDENGEPKPAAPNTINTVTAALKSFFRHMVDARFMAHNPTAFVKKRRGQARKTLPGHLSHSFSEAEVEQLLAFMATHAPVRDYAMIAVSYMTGLRAVELCALGWHDLVNWQGGWYFDVLGKGSKARRVYVPGPAMSALMTYRQAEFGVAPYAPAPGLDVLPVFPNQRKIRARIGRHGVYKLVKKWVKLGLGKDASPHWFRHTCFTQQRLKGATLEAIQAGAGHSSLETTMQYKEAAALMDPAGKVFESGR